MKRLLAACSLLFFYLLPSAHAQTWIGAYGGGGTSTDDVTAVVTDAAGTQYLTGRFDNTITFGATTLTSAGGPDIFVAARDAAGQWLWAVRAGGSGSDSGQDLKIGPGGDLWLISAFEDVADFGPSAFTAQGNLDVAISRLSSTGQWRWTAVAGGPSVEFATGLCLDPAGNATVAGDFGDGVVQADSTISFGTTTLQTAGNFDIFVARLSAMGQWQGAVRAGGAGYDRCYQAVAGPGGSLTLAGQFGRTQGSPGVAATAFGPFTLTPQGQGDAYVARISAANQWEWVVPATGPNNEYCWGLAVDAADNVYVTGGNNGPASFGATTLTSTGQGDGFVAKLNAARQWEWARGIAGSGVETGYGIAVETTGDVLVTGFLNAPASFGPVTLTAAGMTDAFVAALSPVGQWLGAVAAGSSSEAYGFRFGRDAAGHALALGYFNGTASFGGFPLTSAGGGDFYVATLDRTLLGLAPDFSMPAVSFNLFPNPAAARVRLQLAAPLPRAADLRLTDAGGRLVRQQSLAAGCHEAELLVRGLPAGVYVVAIGEAHQRLVVR